MPLLSTEGCVFAQKPLSYMNCPHLLPQSSQHQPIPCLLQKNFGLHCSTSAGHKVSSKKVYAIYKLMAGIQINYNASLVWFCRDGKNKHKPQ